MSLILYRRHAKGCSKSGERANQRGCKCPWWLDGTLFGRDYRKAARTRNYEAAEKIRNGLERGPEIPKGMSFKDASDRFIADLTAQGRQSDTIRKYKHLFDELEKKGTALRDFTFEVLLDIRGSWKNSAASNNKRLDRLKAFFRFAHDAGWIEKNPTKRLKPATTDTEIVKPLAKDEQATILRIPQTSKIRAFVYTIYHSGLRISDCCFLKPQDFDGSNIIRVNRKNRAQVFIPIPPYLKADLDKLPLNGGYYFLIGESVNLHTQTDAWRSILNDLFKKSIPGFHPHRFRHTRVVEWLAHGLTMEEISGIVGTSIKVLEKHYASFAPARQTVVTQKLAKMWEPAKLVRVK